MAGKSRSQKGVASFAGAGHDDLMDD